MGLGLGLGLGLEDLLEHIHAPLSVREADDPRALSQVTQKLGLGLGVGVGSGLGVGLGVGLG